jgi:predicted negative regulator of RcsB-dependent stress response
MTTGSFVFWLFLITLLAGAAYGGWQLWRTRQAQARRGETPGEAHRLPGAATGAVPAEELAAERRAERMAESPAERRTERVD